MCVLDAMESDDLAWYHPWLHGQLANFPHAVKQLRVGADTLLENNAFERVFQAVAKFVLETRGPSIDEVVEHLRTAESMESTPEAFTAQRHLAFAVLGWQSMTYIPAFNTCSLDQFAVHQDDNQFKPGLIFDSDKISIDLADRPLFVILKGFGNLLPSPPSNITQVASEHSKDAATWLPLNPAETNAYLLTTLLHVKIRWVDCLSLHLDYDKSSRTLSLFSCPSFCIAMLQSRGPLFAFASTEKRAWDPRANEDDIAQYMREVLLSYRLLFGQHTRSRKLFPQIYRPPARLPTPDELLPVFCMAKHMDGRIFPGDQPMYFAAQHFPVLSERIELISKELKNSRPTSITDLIRDRRDTLQFWTFWLVSIIGGISVILSLAQVVLQAAQIARE